MLAAVVMVVVILLVGGVSYLVFTKSNPPTTTHTSCVPVSSPACAATLNVHDLSLSVPFRATQQGTVIPFSVLLPSGESARSYNLDFGDGATLTTATPTVDHAYAYPGTYLVSVQATVNGILHDNYRTLVALQVTNSYGSTGSGQVPSVAGTITKNATTSVAPSAVLLSGGSVTVSGSYTSAPTDPTWALGAPSITTSSGGTITSASNTSSNAVATVSFSAPGAHTASFVGVSTGPTGTLAHQNYVWTVFVAPVNFHAGVAGASASKSPHPGTIIAYENTPGGTYTSDPAIDYDIVGFEILINIYQTLIFYNGTQTGTNPESFVPELATCVPGSALCSKLYGTPLVTGSNYTFVVSHTANFYDPATKASWGVWPSDVLFSLARTMGFSMLPCYTCNNGWILSQALLSAGDPTNSLHSTLNNTPANIFQAVTVNDSKYCTSAMMTGDHGCVTFHANANGKNWPYILQLIADGEGASVVPCGWFSASAQGAGIPWWTQGNVSGAGDRPCLLPGGARSSSDAAFQTAVGMIPANGWDTWEPAGSSPPFLGNVQNNMVGSGPYYMLNYKPGISYQLAANPAYGANPSCSWANCFPAAGRYAGNVSVIWETSPSIGEQAMVAGVADYSGVPSTDFALLLQLVQEGRATAISIPTINLYFFPFVMNFNLQLAQRYTTNPINVPADWFSYLGMRQFFVHSYPYSTIQSTINTKDGIQVGFPYGGAIPQFMGNYYPKGVNWPGSDPCTSMTDQNCPGYWWSQMRSSSSAYYDPEAASCSSSAPCEFPIFGVTGDSDTDQRLALWANNIAQVSGGALKPHIIDVIESDVVTGQYSSPGQNFLTLYAIRWVPDYPDPTDYVRPMYLPDAVYTYSGAVAEELSQASFNASSGCPGAWNAYNTYANLTSVVPQSCQGTAYAAMNYAFSLAGPLPAGPQRANLYARGEAIANQLAMYVYMYQQNLVPTLGPWVDSLSFNANPVIGAGGDTPWYWLTGNSVQFAGSA